MRIGILTYFRNYNNGAFLQAYALSSYLKKLHCEWAVEVVDFQMEKEVKFHVRNLNNIQRRMKTEEIAYRENFDNALNNLRLSADKIVTDDPMELKLFLDRHYDVVVVGSDEIWKIDSFRGFPTPFWCNFPLENCLKMSYAASSRCNVNKMRQEDIDYIKKALRDFAYIGLRDQTTFDAFKKLGVENLHINCDPTFTLDVSYDKEAFVAEMRQRYPLSDKKIIGVIMQDERYARKLKEMYGAEYQIVSLYFENRTADISMQELEPFEWVKMIGCCDFVVTQMFHGTVFSVLNGVNFLAVDREKDGKITCLLRELGMEDHGVVMEEKWDTLYNVVHKVKACMKQTPDFESCILNERKKIEGFVAYLEEVAKK